MELFGESYARYFPVPDGVIGVLADIYADETLAVLDNLIVYPVDHEFLNIGVKAMLAIRRQIDVDLSQLGFTGVRITGIRLTGASPGRTVNVRRGLR